MLNFDVSSEEEDQIYEIQEESSSGSESNASNYYDGYSSCVCQFKSINMISSKKGLII